MRDRATVVTWVGLTLTLALGLAAACQSPSPPSTGSPPAQNAVIPGEEPLETATLGDEEVVPLKPEPRAMTPSAGRPCAWAAAWNDPRAAHPVLSGVGGAPTPEKTKDAPISIPVKEGPPTGEIVVEIVIDPDGSVAEASVVHAAEPRHPEVEAAIIKGVRAWRYEKPTFDGTPVAVCSTLVLRP